ncbi:MAG: DUF192 domain-containing protein [Steroidobacteraceae bacterium]
MTVHRRLRDPLIPRLALTLLLVALTSAAARAQQPPEELSHFPQSDLTIASHGKLHKFRIWLADNSRRKQQGLMFVRDLPADRGMLFVNDQPYIASMWMKNTFVALDMVFIGADGRIAEIRANTTPHSLEIIAPREPALAVLELRGGEAARLGIAPGDAVDHPTLRHNTGRRKKATQDQ